MHHILNYQLFKRFLQQALILTLATCAFTVSAKDSASVQKPLINSNKVSIQDAWVRPTRTGQAVGAAYMTFTSQQDTTLIHVESDATKNVEIHSMSMKNGIMKMRMLDTLPLAAGKPYKLEPGGFHLMLFDLKKPLTEGEQVNFEFTFKNKDHVEFKQQVKTTVKPANDEADGSAHEGHH